MILSYNGNFINFGGRFINLKTKSDDIVIGGITYSTVAIGNYIWTTTNLTNHLSTGSHTHEDNEFYRRDAIAEVLKLLPEGWTLPDKEAFDNLCENRNSFNFVLCGYEDGGGTWKYNGSRCYMMGNDSNYTGLMYWYKSSDTPNFDNPTIDNAYASDTDYRFPIRVCKKVS